MSSLRLMKALADRGHDVTLVVTTAGGSLEPSLDPRIHLVHLRPASFGDKFLRANGFVNRMAAFPDLLAYVIVRFIGGLRMLAFRFQYYDAAITLLHGTSTWFCRRVVRARIRFHFIRNDLSKADPTGRVIRAIQRASLEIDHYICVSGIARKSLVTALPDAESKAVVIYNILNPAEMRLRMVEDESPFPKRKKDELRILTVCRLSEKAKGLVRMAQVCRRLSDEGLNFRWFVVGDGPDREQLEQTIHSLGIENKMVLLGHRMNPFPAYAHADIVAMVSNYEGLCGMVNEAKIAGRPVVATLVSGVSEQLVDEETGLIVDNDEDAIVEGMRRILSDKKLRHRLTNEHLPAALLDDSAKLEQFEKLLHNKRTRK